MKGNVACGLHVNGSTPNIFRPQTIGAGDGRDRVWTANGCVMDDEWKNDTDISEFKFYQLTTENVYFVILIIWEPSFMQEDKNRFMEPTSPHLHREFEDIFNKNLVKDLISFTALIFYRTCSLPQLLTMIISWICQQ